MSNHMDQFSKSESEKPEPFAFEQRLNEMERNGNQCIEESQSPERVCRSQANDASNALMDEVYSYVSKELQKNGPAGIGAALEKSQASWNAYRDSVLDFHGEPSTSRDHEPLTGELNLSRNRSQELLGMLKGGNVSRLRTEAKACLDNSQDAKSCLENAAAKQWVSADKAFEAFAEGFKNNEELKEKFDNTKNNFDQFRSLEFAVINKLFPIESKDAVKGIALKADIMRNRHDQIYNSDLFFETSTKR